VTLASNHHGGGIRQGRDQDRGVGRPIGEIVREVLVVEEIWILLQGATRQGVLAPHQDMVDVATMRTAVRENVTKKCVKGIGPAQIATQTVFVAVLHVFDVERPSLGQRLFRSMVVIGHVRLAMQMYSHVEMNVSNVVLPDQCLVDKMVGMGRQPHTWERHMECRICLNRCHHKGILDRVIGLVRNVVQMFLLLEMNATNVVRQNHQVLVNHNLLTLVIHLIMVGIMSPQWAKVLPTGSEQVTGYVQALNVVLIIMLHVRRAFDAMAHVVHQHLWVEVATHRSSLRRMVGTNIKDAPPQNVRETGSVVVGRTVLQVATDALSAMPQNLTLVC